MKLPEMKTGLVLSALGHAALLLWGLVSFAVRPLEAAPTAALPIDIISDKQFSELAKGVKDAPKAPEPKPLVEKIGDPKPAEEMAPKVAEKKEIKAAKAEAPPPPQEEPTPTKKAEKKPEPKVDPIAETLKKEEQRKKAEQRKPQPKFDPTKIAALLDKREPQRQVATGTAYSSTPSLGYVNGQAAQLSQSELDALRARLTQCWNPPMGATSTTKVKVVLRVLFKPDGSVAAPPVLVAGTASELGPPMAESAKRAILTCQPFTMLKPEHYQQWKDIEITFDPTEMFGG